MKSPRTWWLIFVACTAAVVIVLVWITTVVVRLEQRERQAQADATYQEALRLALWRMDSWLGPRLAREAARSVSGYTAAAPMSRAYEVRFHFEVDVDGNVTGPPGIDEPGVEIVRGIVATEDLAIRIADAEAGFADIAIASAGTGDAIFDAWRSPQSDEVGQQARARQELTQRQLDYQLNVAPPRELAARDEIVAGPLVPLWAGTKMPGGEPELLFVRRINVDSLAPGDAVVQGFLCDWRELRTALLTRIADLLPGALLVPVRGQATSTEMLASIPVELRGTASASAPVALVSPATTVLVIMWVAVLAALAAVAITLRASIAFGEKRSRFASAVTHELRTPLTTFRLYAEMLAEGMVTTDEQRDTYLRTLRDEADRLGALVENVLAYARLERGAAEIRLREVTVGALLSEVRPALERQAQRGSMTLEFEVDDPARSVRVDVEGVTQILVNLVENAVKYAADAGHRVIDVSVRDEGERLAITVRDHGPGVDRRHASAIFAPFERGAREPGDTTPGVGLGLSLSRGLARRMGGDLRLAAVEGDGACFELCLPGGLRAGK